MGISVSPNEVLVERTHVYTYTRTHMTVTLGLSRLMDAIGAQELCVGLSVRTSLGEAKNIDKQINSMTQPYSNNISITIL